MKAPNTGEKRRCMTTNYPPTLGLVLAGGLARRGMGGGDKRVSRSAVYRSSTVRWQRCPRNAPESLSTPTAIPGALRRYRPDCCGRHRAGFRRPAGQDPCRSRLAGEAEERHRVDCQRPGIALSCPTTSSNACIKPAATWALACRSPARAQANGVIRWLVYGRWGARRFAQSTGRGAPAQNQFGPRDQASLSLISPISRLTRSSTSIRRKMRPGRSALRCSKRARDILDRTQRVLICYGRNLWVWEDLFMKAFILACAAAIVIAVVGSVALNSMPDSAEKAFTSSTGVRLGA